MKLFIISAIGLFLLVVDTSFADVSPPSEPIYQICECRTPSILGPFWVNLSLWEGQPPGVCQAMICTATTACRPALANDNGMYRPKVLPLSKDDCNRNGLALLDFYYILY